MAVFSGSYTGHRGMLFSSAVMILRRAQKGSRALGWSDNTFRFWGLGPFCMKHTFHMILQAAMNANQVDGEVIEKPVIRPQHRIIFPADPELSTVYLDFHNMKQNPLSTDPRAGAETSEQSHQ